jgi:hypothetical protein
MIGQTLPTRTTEIVNERPRIYEDARNTREWSDAPSEVPAELRHRSRFGDP